MKMFLVLMALCLVIFASPAFANDYSPGGETLCVSGLSVTPDFGLDQDLVVEAPMDATPGHEAVVALVGIITSTGSTIKDCSSHIDCSWPNGDGMRPKSYFAFDDNLHRFIMA